MRVKGENRSISHESLNVRLPPTGEPLRIHALSGYVSSLYICEYPERGETLLLDGGVPGDFDRVNHFVKNGLTSGPSDTQRLTCALSTHAHIDHVGSIERHLENGTNCFVAEDWESYYTGAGGAFQRVVDAGLASLVAYRLGRGFDYMWHNGSLSSTNPNLAKTRLRDGTQIPGFEDWIAIHVPGHTGHMVALYQPTTNILYAADLIIHHKKDFWPPIPLDIPYAYNHTLHRLRKLTVDWLLLPHGGIVNVEEVGGWDAILDIVADNAANKTSTNLTKSFVEKALVGWGNDNHRFDRDRLPRTPLPQGSSTPAEVYHLR